MFLKDVCLGNLRGREKITLPSAALFEILLHLHRMSCIMPLIIPIGTIYKPLNFYAQRNA